MTRVWDVPVHDSTQAHDVRVAVEAACDHVGLGADRTADADLAATELATNLLRHAGGGRILIDTADDGRPVVQMLAVDHGPGIRDVAAALRDGYSTTTSLGAGLGACRRIADTFDLHTAPGRGTVVLVRMADRRTTRRAEAAPAVRPVRVGGVHVPLVGETCGDAWACVPGRDRLTLVLADGLGHGPEGARASAAAVDELRRVPDLPPVEMLRRLDDALRGTRGAAVALAQLAQHTGHMLFAGVGNVGARLRTERGWQPLLSRPGIVGAYRPAVVPERQLPWKDGGLLILHSDGLPSRWAPPEDSYLDHRDPAVIAAVVLRDASSSARPARDDTTVAVMASTPRDRPL
ncbi:SpoIIE family protein phosphatase [Streptantibioticus rubrisoli]|uniref:SpoIIE family protein phosphatase n=1 Tax=Streptantibioticus rubrisoli TaxID=1387313 RepID=A0ABT1P9I0_9ACTN|nr:ATP-binding SpoIIE family protein phosphatase [Streptantibioticus rubrisoli]MCQ4041088.1 SpoIIE family protein phosphatase [Streptantibioticus rubrisoli]